MAGDKNEYILSINGMSKSFGRNKVLKHISLNVKPGLSWDLWVRTEPENRQ